MGTGRFGAEIILEDMAKESIAIVGVGLLLVIPPARASGAESLKRQ